MRDQPARAEPDPAALASLPPAHHRGRRHRALAEAGRVRLNRECERIIKGRIPLVQSSPQLAAGGFNKPLARMTSTDPIEPTEGVPRRPRRRAALPRLGGCRPSRRISLHGNGFCAGTHAPFVRPLAGQLHITASGIRSHSGSEFETIERIRNWRVFAEDLKLLIRGTRDAAGHRHGPLPGGRWRPPLRPRRTRIFSRRSSSSIRCFCTPRTLWKAAGMRLLGLARGGGRVLRQRPQAPGGSSTARPMHSATLSRAASSRAGRRSSSRHIWSAGFLKRRMRQTAVLRCDPELEAQIFESVPLGVWSQCRKIRCPGAGRAGGSRMCS
ncbi:MAG: hypothetical protein MZV70_29990 [Desulfobacterales bacterium]|nr:hypothetical protein [Desulfobacterales bacterium]